MFLPLVPESQDNRPSAVPKNPIRRDVSLVMIVPPVLAMVVAKIVVVFVVPPVFAPMTCTNPIVMLQSIDPTAGLVKLAL